MAAVVYADPIGLSYFEIGRASESLQGVVVVMDVGGKGAAWRFNVEEQSRCKLGLKSAERSLQNEPWRKSTGGRGSTLKGARLRAILKS
jgi:hypothetical protein